VCFGAACAGLDIHEAVERVGGVGEHAPELELFQACAQGIGIAFDGSQRGIIVVICGKFKKFLGVGQANTDFGKGMNRGFEAFFLAAEFLCVFGVVPDLCAFEFGVYDLQTFRLGIVVKDTPEVPIDDLRSLPGGRRVGFDVRLP
jgi:hypothetical protein